MHDYLLKTYHTHMVIRNFFLSKSCKFWAIGFFVKNEIKAHVQIRFFKSNNCKKLP